MFKINVSSILFFFFFFPRRKVSLIYIYFFMFIGSAPLAAMLDLGQAG